MAIKDGTRTSILSNLEFHLVVYIDIFKDLINLSHDVSWLFVEHNVEVFFLVDASSSSGIPVFFVIFFIFSSSSVIVVDSSIALR